MAHDVEHVSQAAAPAIFHLEHAALAEGVTRGYTHAHVGRRAAGERNGDRRGCWHLRRRAEVNTVKPHHVGVQALRLLLRFRFGV